MAAQQKRHPEYPRSAAIDLTPLLGAVCTSPIPHPSTAHYHASLVPALATVLYVASWQDKLFRTGNDNDYPQKLISEKPDRSRIKLGRRRKKRESGPSAR